MRACWPPLLLSRKRSGAAGWNQRLIFNQPAADSTRIWCSQDRNRATAALFDR